MFVFLKTKNLLDFENSELSEKKCEKLENKNYVVIWEYFVANEFSGDY